MKKVLSILALVSLVSCAPKKVTKTVMIENPFDNSQNDTRLTNLETKVAALQSSISSSITTMGSLSSSLQSLESEIDQLRDELEQSNSEEADAIQQIIDNNTASHNSLLAMINSIQGQVNTNISQLVSLQSQNTIIAYLDPCGDKPNAYDEIILKTSQGEFIAYFEQNGNRFLTKLEKNVLYQTTDSQACQFKIDNNGNLI